MKFTFDTLEFACIVAGIYRSYGHTATIREHMDDLTFVVEVSSDAVR